MILTIRDIEPSDLGHLFCSDRRLAEAVAAIHRPNGRTERFKDLGGRLRLEDPYLAHVEKEVQA